jgi:hypothetical protein
MAMMRLKTRCRITIGFLLLTTGVPAQVAATKPADPLLEGFRHPPQSARPLVWWHWMNGNISQEGIKLDLEWMHRVGIGGFQNFEPNARKITFTDVTPYRADSPLMPSGLLGPVQILRESTKEP